MWPRKGSYPEYDALMRKVRETGKGMLIGWDVGSYAYEIRDGVARKTVQHRGNCPITSHYGVNYSDQHKSAVPSVIT
jgi:hypothetical protein